ncbi:MAG TPA: transcription termination factor Rho [Myxococcales bacterium]|jgi:transcription termination factor Rho|nr:transcription termination factor Rho [Myxococcales bacterium]
MSTEGQRPPAEAPAHDAPEPGNARYPQPNGGAQPNGQQGTNQAANAGEGGGRRRFRRQRRGGRGRGRGKGGGGQGQKSNEPGYSPPLDAQGRIYDVENDANGNALENADAADELEDGSPDGRATPGPLGRPADDPAVQRAMAVFAGGSHDQGNAGSQTGADIDGDAAGGASSSAAPGNQGRADRSAGAHADASTPGDPGGPAAEHPRAEGNAQGQPHGQKQHGQRHQRNQQHHNQQRQQPAPRQETLQAVEGVLDVDHRGNGKLRDPKRNFLPQQDDVEVPRHLIDRDKLRAGSVIVGQAAKRNGRLQVIKIDSVEGQTAAQAAARTAFQNLTVIDPDDRLIMETSPKEILTRVIDIVAPIGLGQRALIVAPPKTGKTIMLQKICHAITANRPEVVQFVLLVDERPEEVTDFRRSVKAEVYASSADRPTEEHLHVAEMVMERAKRLVEGGKDVVILLDSITRLSRAYNKEVESSGRTLSGGVDSRALERPKRLFGAARNAEEGGSLTIIATALIDTGSRMDEVIFEEFKGTGNLEINLDRALAEKRIWPAINIQTSGTRKEEKLFSQHEYDKVKKLRGALYALKPVEAMERLIKLLNETGSNAEFLEAI